MKILLVDDNLLIQQVICRFLMGQGYTVIVTSNTRDALSLARMQHYDLFLIDLHLFDHDDLDLLAALRNHPGYAGSPIVAISGLGEEQRLRAYQDGFNGYLAKPIDLDELLDTVSQFCGVRMERALGV
jgi:CheY-like chemotaxis protein